VHLSATLELYQLVNEAVSSSEYLCSAGGKFCNHSAEFLMCVGNKGSRLGVILSHMNRILQVCTVHQWRLKHYIIQQMHKYIIRRYN
jgi:hypothetical protein